MKRRVGLIQGGKASDEVSFGGGAVAGVPRNSASDLVLPGVTRDGTRDGNGEALAAPFLAVGDSRTSLVRNLEPGVLEPLPPGVCRPGVDDEEGRIFSRWLYNLL